MMHDEEFLNEAITAYRNSKGIHSLLLELRERRRAEKEYACISGGEDRKNSAETIAEPLKELIDLRERVALYKDIIQKLDKGMQKILISLPQPCVKIGDKKLHEYTAKEWMSDIHEEVTELHEAMISYESSKCGGDFNNFIEEAMDVITVITSMLSAYGCTEENRMGAQRKVNLKNEKRGRLY